MEKAEPQQRTYVVYPAALFDGWEVVKDGDEPKFFETPREAMDYATACARTDAASVELEDWFGETIGRWDYPRRPR